MYVWLPSLLCSSYWSLTGSGPQRFPSALYSPLAALHPQTTRTAALRKQNISVDYNITIMHTPAMSLLICVWTGPFSRLWTTVLAIRVRCPMYPLLIPPADLNTKVSRRGALMLVTVSKDIIVPLIQSFSYCILSFSSQASRILWTRWHCWNNLREIKVQSNNCFQSQWFKFHLQILGSNTSRDTYMSHH